MPPAFPKTCTTCGAIHSAAAWAALEFKGTMDDRATDPEGELLELRNCRCGSTLAIVLAGPTPKPL